MDEKQINQLIFEFFKEEVQGIRITDESGKVIYEDEKSSFISREKTNWDKGCPPPQEDGPAQTWDLLCNDQGNTYMVQTSTLRIGEELFQIHHIVDTSVYTDLYHDITGYTKAIMKEKDRDGLTGLYNRGKFIELCRTLFPGKDSITVFGMDVNNLKQMNDVYGHEAGDKLIKKGAESLRRLEARNIMAFRVGGDEFVLVALHLSHEGALKLLKDWEDGLSKLNEADDGIHCVMACGMAYGTQGYDLGELIAEADRLMYEDKKEKKRRMGQA